MSKLFQWYRDDDAKGLPGMKANTSTDVCDSYTAEEGVNPGDAVIRGTEDGLCKPLTSNADGNKVIGIAVHVHREPRDGAYYEKGYCLPVMSFGDIYVRAGGEVHAGEPAAISMDDNGMAYTAATADTAVAGVRTYTVTTNLADGDTVKIGTTTLTAKATGATGAQFNVGADVNASVTALVATLKGQKKITDVFDVTSKDATFTLTEKNAGNGNTPGEAVVTGTGKISSAAPTASVAASSSAIKGLTFMESSSADDIVRLRVRL